MIRNPDKMDKTSLTNNRERDEPRKEREYSGERDYNPPDHHEAGLSPTMLQYRNSILAGADN